MFQTSSKKLFKNILLSLVIFSSISFSQTTRSSFKILGISVEGNKSADASTIIANSGLKVNDEIQIPGDQTLNAIKQLWSLNIFSLILGRIVQYSPKSTFFFNSFSSSNS